MYILTIQLDGLLFHCQQRGLDPAWVRAGLAKRSAWSGVTLQRC